MTMRGVLYRTPTLGEEGTMPIRTELNREDEGEILNECWTHTHDGEAHGGDNHDQMEVPPLTSPDPYVNEGVREDIPDGSKGLQTMDRESILRLPPSPAQPSPRQSILPPDAHKIAHAQPQDHEWFL